MANVDLITLAQARQHAQSSKTYTDDQVAEVATAAAEAIQEVVDNLPISKTITLTTAGWSSNTQVVSVSEVTASNTVVVSAANTSRDAYSAAEVVCTAQTAGKLTFTCTTAPTVALTVNLVIIN